MQKVMRNDKGLTLIEVLLSITILGIIATSFLSFFTQSYSYTKMNEDKTVGINVARNVLYYIEKQDFQKIKEAYLSTDDTMEVTIDNCGDSVKNNPSKTVFDDPNVCREFFTSRINNVDFTSTVSFSKELVDPENPSESKPNLQSQLIGVVVNVKWDDEKETEVKGLIEK